MKYRIAKTEVYDGLNIINNIPHGSKWKDRFEVTFFFDDKTKAEDFASKVVNEIVARVK